MKTFIFALILLFFLSYQALAESEYYHYVDEHGVKHFTENYADIPEKFNARFTGKNESL